MNYFMKEDISMKGKISIFNIISVVFIVLSFLAGYALGSAQNKAEPSVTFYAEIQKIQDNYMLVEGLEINDINTRGSFDFSIDEDTILEWRHTEISISDFEIGDLVSITYTGSVKESYPAGITKVVKIQLLEDE